MSPLLNQFITLKAKYPDVILLFRVGDAYKSFAEDAKLVSQLTGAKLTTSSDSGINMVAGIPFHSLDAHLRTLMKSGYKMAVCEQLEDPKKANRIGKNGGKNSLKS